MNILNITKVTNMFEKKYLIRNYTFSFIFCFIMLRGFSFSLDTFFFYLYFLLSALIYPFARYIFHKFFNIYITGTYLVPFPLAFAIKVFRFLFIFIFSIPLGIISLVYLDKMQQNYLKKNTNN